MSQQFSKDAQYTQNSPAVVVPGPSFIIETNALTPPYGNCKAVIKAQYSAPIDATTTGIGIEIHRNRNAENITLGFGESDFTATTQPFVTVQVMLTDEIPDGRDVSYSAFIYTFGAGGDIVAGQLCFIEAELISG
jgi:hypothetical protein